MNAGTVRTLNGGASSSLVTFTRQSYSMNGSGSGDSTNTIIVDKLKKLMFAIESYLAEFIGYLSGDITELPKQFNLNLISKLSSIFYSLKVPSLKSTVYEQYRLFTLSIVNSLQNINTFVLNCQQKSALLEAVTEKASILDDIKKLQEFINNLKTKFMLIPEQTVTIPMAQIKEPYNTYIKLYGFPENMVWDTDKLAFVIQLLKL